MPLDQVEAVATDIRLRVAADQLRTGAGEAGVPEQLIGRIPRAMRLSELLGAEVVDGG